MLRGSRRSRKHPWSCKKSFVGPGSALGRAAVNLIRGVSRLRQPVPNLAISAAGPPDGRPACSTGVLRPPASTEHARQARRGHLVDRPERALLCRRRLWRRGSRATWRARRCAGRPIWAGPGGQLGLSRARSRARWPCSELAELPGQGQSSAGAAWSTGATSSRPIGKELSWGSCPEMLLLPHEL